jgi:hypothetical protein
MVTSLLSRLTYANVASTLALFIALGGVSYAAVRLPANSVGAKQLKKNAVTGLKIKNRAVSATKIARNAVTGYNVDEGTLAPVPEAVRSTSAGSAALSRLDYESTVTTLPAGTATTAIATCPDGLYLTGGGARVADDTTASVNDSAPLNRTTWEATGVTDAVAGSMTVYAICAPAASVTPTP